LQEVHAVIENAQWGPGGKGEAAPLSILTILDTLPGSADDRGAQFKELQYVPADRLRSLVREDRRLALVTANVPDAGAAALKGPLDRLEQELGRVERSHPGYGVYPTGFAIVSTYRATPMILDLFEGLSLEVVVIFAVIALLLRSPLLGVLSLPSNLFPLLATVTTVVLLGWKLQYATVLALNICLGIAVDDTVHFLSRYRDELRRTGDRRSAVRISFRDVAPVMATTTVLMLTGFGAGLFSTIPTIRSFSGGSCLALVFALASECLVLPTLLYCLADTAGGMRKDAAPIAAGPLGRQEASHVVE
jgi:predicted RND superfamily exporter protein